MRGITATMEQEIKGWPKHNQKKVIAVNAKTGDVVEFKSTMDAERKGYSQGCVAAACRGVYKTNYGKLIGDGCTYKGLRWSYEVEE